MSFFKSLFNKNNKEKNDQENIINNKIIKEDLPLIFAEKFTENKGIFFYCETKQDVINNLQQVLNHENINLIYCKQDNLFDLITNFDVGFTDNKLDNPDAIIITADYIEATTGKIFISKQKKDLYNIDSNIDKIIILASENILKDKFINLYNEYYSIQKQNQFTTFSIFIKEIILLFIEEND